VAERHFGPYRLVRQVAVGGMAEIHLAKTKGIAGFEKYIAIKMIHPNFAEDEQFIQMLVDEAKIAVNLTHGNIAQTFDLGRVGETYYITMEFVDGADLYKLLRRGSEMDLEMPLDVCAFIGKEVASALDYAHRKKDHVGKSLGIVHRDVSPQNVLVSYAGEVKLVDFGIAKATMKVRQTAAGVIKGKYYYMSPEQAWGDPIDYRSDIFSAGIVLYEMITGQMLYLEEDLHKLLDMARKADIAPPTTLRKGVPPQLERIVMHALAKSPGERYQSAADFASDLERFLHAYSPVFTAAKLAGLLRKIIGDPIQVPDNAQEFPSIEVRDGPMSTHPLGDEDLIHDKAEIRDENSVIFRVKEVDQGPTARIRKSTPAKANPVKVNPAGRMTRAHERAPSTPDPEIKPIPKVALKAQPVRPRDRSEETRELGAAPADPNTEDSGLLTLEGTRGRIETPDADTLPPSEPAWADAVETDDLENIGERTVITGAPGGFMMDNSGDGIEATLVTGAPEPEDNDTEDEHDDHPTLTVEKPVRVPRNAPPPPALAAKIHSPAVSEIRKPRPSRRTPPGGVPSQGNVLQQIVGAQASAPMPVPRPTAASAAPPPPAPYHPPPGFPTGSGQVNGYGNDASGLPLGVPTPSGMPVTQQAVPPHMAYSQYPTLQPGYPGYPTPTPPYQQVTPGALYQMQAQPQPMSLTGQLRLFEADELPPHYKLDTGPKRWFIYIVAGLLAISVAAATTFFIIRTTRDTTPTSGAIHVESVPPGAEVSFDGNRMSEKTPLTIEGIPVGTRHQIRVELPHYKPHVEEIDVPKTGADVPVMALMHPLTGKIRVDSTPAGAEIRINDAIRGRTPTTLNDLDMGTAKQIELRLKDYEPYIQKLEWPANGEIDIQKKLERTK
jgi:serine/threonine protein kinase